MLACWHGEPKERPTFPVLVQILGDLLQDNSLPVSSLSERHSFQHVISFFFFFLVHGLVLSLKKKILSRMGRTMSPWTTHRAQRTTASRRRHHGLHLRRSWDWPVTRCPTGTHTHLENCPKPQNCHCEALCHINIFPHLLNRYYNCVPFAGCVFVAPSNIYQPRVKTFEELPLKVHTQKTPQVTSLPSSIVEKLNWVVTFLQMPGKRPPLTIFSIAAAFRHRLLIQPSLLPGQPDRQRDGFGLWRAEENWTPAERCRLKEVSPTKPVICIGLSGRQWHTASFCSNNTVTAGLESVRHFFLCISEG